MTDIKRCDGCGKTPTGETGREPWGVLSVPGQEKKDLCSVCGKATSAFLRDRLENVSTRKSAGVTQPEVPEDID